MLVRPHRLLAGFLIAALLLALGLPLVQSAAREQARARRASLRASAHQRWQQSAVDTYELDMLENNCRYHSTVRNEAATVHPAAGACAMAPATVDELFVLAARDGQHEALCDQHGCPCESYVDAAAEYDLQLGFPAHLVVDVELRPAWFTADLWRHIWRTGGLPPCLQSNRSDIRVLTLTPAH